MASDTGFFNSDIKFPFKIDFLKNSAVKLWEWPLFMILSRLEKIAVDSSAHFGQELGLDVLFPNILN